MTPDLVSRVRVALAEYESLLADNGMPETMARAREIAALLAALPPDPGGAMPEPDAGMRVTTPSGLRTVVDYAHPRIGGGWNFMAAPGVERRWCSENVSEVRDATGRVLWRAE